MSAQHRPRTWTTVHAVEAWHGLAEHGGGHAAAAAMGMTPSMLQSRLATYRELHGLPRRAMPWDLSGRLVLTCQHGRPAATARSLDTLLEGLEHARDAGDHIHADHIQAHLRRLEARYYGEGMEPLPRHVRRALRGNGDTDRQ